MNGWIFSSFIPFYRLKYYFKKFFLAYSTWGILVIVIDDSQYSQNEWVNEYG